MANSEDSTATISSQSDSSVEAFYAKLDIPLLLEACKLGASKGPIDDAAWEKLGDPEMLISQARILTQISLGALEVFASRQDRRRLVEILEELFVTAENATCELDDSEGLVDNEG